jgi:thiol-disulfide isomerase/thioredoxin
LLIAALVAAGAVAVAGCSTDAATSSSSQTTPAVSTSASSSAPAAASSALASTPPAASSGGTTSPSSAAVPATAGSYIDYATYTADPAKYAGSDVVLFFNASWCPTCQEATGNLESNPVPAGLTVVSVDYDDAVDLKQKYGVTVQHTFVQVSPDGAEMAKWSGSTTASEIQSKVV